MNQEEEKLLEKIIEQKLGNKSFEERQKTKHQLEEFLDIVSLIIADEIAKK
jgi:hypothetical protein